MITSSTSAGSMPARATTAATTCPPSTGASVSLNDPRNDLASAVRAVATITTSFRSMTNSLGNWVEGVAADGVDHATGSRLALDFYVDAHHQLHGVAQLFGADDLAAAAHP